MLMIGVIDIDRFKQINDCNGNAAGDKVLIEVAKTLRMNIRSYDLIARLGGDASMLFYALIIIRILAIQKDI